jgi:hypothetical protein
MIWDFFLIDETWLREPKWKPGTDAREPGPFDLARWLPGRGPLRWRRVPSSWGPADYVRQVREDLRGDRIRTLSVHAHGDAGLIRLGHRAGWLTLGSVGELEPLRDCFARGSGFRPRVDLCCCYAAADAAVDLDAALDRYQTCARGGWTDPACVGLQGNPFPRGTLDVRRPGGPGLGVSMLQALAAVLRVPVRAPIDYLPNILAPGLFSLPGTTDRVIEVWPAGGGGLLRRMIDDWKSQETR